VRLWSAHRDLARSELRRWWIGAKSGGGGRTELASGSREGCAGLLDASDRRGVLLRWRWGGQRGQSKAGGKKS